MKFHSIYKDTNAYRFIKEQKYQYQQQQINHSIDTKQIVKNVILDTHNKHQQIEKTKTKTEIKEEKKKLEKQQINDEMKYLMFIPVIEKSNHNNNSHNGSNTIVNKYDYIPRYTN